MREEREEAGRGVRDHPFPSHSRSIHPPCWPCLAGPMSPAGGLSNAGRGRGRYPDGGGGLAAPRSDRASGLVPLAGRDTFEPTRSFGDLIEDSTLAWPLLLCPRWRDEGGTGGGQPVVNLIRAPPLLSCFSLTELISSASLGRGGGEVQLIVTGMGTSAAHNG